MSPNAFSHRTWMSYDRHTLVSRDSIIAASAVERSRFFILQMQLIVQPYYLSIFKNKRNNSYRFYNLIIIPGLLKKKSATW